MVEEEVEDVAEGGVDPEGVDVNYCNCVIINSKTIVVIKKLSFAGNILTNMF